MAILAERAAGTPFVDLVQQRICTPANMVDTAYLRSDNSQNAPRSATSTPRVTAATSSTSRSEAAATAARTRPSLTSIGCGRPYTTSPCSIKPTLSAALRPRSDVPSEGSRYGLGFWLHATGPGVMFDGSDAGVSFRTVHDPDSDTTHTVIANWSNGAWPVTRALDGILLGW